MQDKFNNWNKLKQKIENKEDLEEIYNEFLEDVKKTASNL